MEKELGHSLFNRSTQGLTLTDFGASLLDESRLMEQSARRLERLVHGQEQQLHGRIRVSANEVIALYYLPKILPAFLDAYTHLSVELEVSNQASSIDKRVDGARAMGLQLTNEQFLFRCDFMPMQIALCINGGGIAVTHESVAQTHELVNVCPDIKLPDLPVYLVCHRDVQHNRAIRVMMDFLASNLSS